jgi:hypothetical protein
LVHDSI